MFKILALFSLMQQATAGEGDSSFSSFFSFSARRVDTSSSSIMSHRHLSDASIDGYEPRSTILDHSTIDLDQATMEQLMNEGDFQSAMDVYYEGAFSKPYADLHVPTIQKRIEAGTKLKVVDDDGTEYWGKALVDIEVGETVVAFQYTDAMDFPCNVGGLPSKLQHLEGCLPQVEYLQIAHQNEITYSYTPTKENLNDRTLARFSTGAKYEMHDCVNCPYATYEKFTNYYGHFQYGHVFVAAAYESSATSVLKGGSMDFSSYNDAARSEVILKGSVYLNLWMYAIRAMERALDTCEARCDPSDQSCSSILDAVSYWDEAVALYTGSLEQGNQEQDKSSPTTGDGVLLYALADQMCQYFKTCGEDSDDVKGTSKVNIEIFRYFKAGQNYLLLGDCNSARKHKEVIEEFMSVPLIQGTLRYAWINDYEVETATDTDEAVGAVFAASVLPLVNACDASDADALHQILRAGRPDIRTNFQVVKGLLERHYDCMGITCDQVGGLYDGYDQTYLAHAAPCISRSNKTSTAGIVAAVFGSLGALLVIFFVWFKLYKRKQPEDMPFVGGTHVIGSKEMS